MNDIFAGTFPILLITMLGSVIKRKWIISEEFWRGLEKLSYFFLFPCLLFNNISGADLKDLSLGRLIISLILASSLVAAALIWYAERYKVDKIKCVIVVKVEIGIGIGK